MEEPSRRIDGDRADRRPDCQRQHVDFWRDILFHQLQACAAECRLVGAPDRMRHFYRRAAILGNAVGSDRAQAEFVAGEPGLSALLSYPMVTLIQGQFWQVAVAISASMFVLAAWTSIAPAVYAELFPTRIRATGTAIPYSLTVALFGGTAPYVQNWLASMDRMDIFSGYLALLNVLTVVTILTMPETRGRPLA